MQINFRKTRINRAVALIVASFVFSVSGSANAATVGLRDYEKLKQDVAKTGIASVKVLLVKANLDDLKNRDFDLEGNTKNKLQFFLTS